MLMLQIRRSRRLSVCIETKYSQQCSSSSHLLTFDMVAEIEFDIKKEGKKFYVTSSHFWMTTDRNIDGYFEIQFDKQQQKEFGKLVDTRLAATIAKKNACFKVGYTQDTDHVTSDSNHKPILCEPSPSPHASNGAQYEY